MAVAGRRWRPSARQRPHVGATASRPDRERRRAAVDLHVPDHRVRQPVLEPEPDRRGHRDVVGVVQAPVGSGEDLLRNARVGDDRVDRDVGQVAALVRPGERGAVRRARDLEDMAGRRRRVGVEAADRRVADRQVRVGADGSSAIPSTGRFGRTVLPPVTFTQLACDAMPVPRLKPIRTLPSFVPTIASLGHLGEYLTWLMNERLPSVCLVMFWVDGLFVTYQLAAFIAALPPVIVSQTLVVPATRWPQPPGAPAGAQSSPPGIPPWKRSYGRMNDCVSAVPVAADASRSRCRRRGRCWWRW